MQSKVQAAAGWTITKVKRTAEDLARLKGFSLKSLKGLAAILVPVVKEVEEARGIYDLGPTEAQSLAVELIARIVPAPWWLPESWYREGLAVAVDHTVAALKDTFKKK